VREPWRVAQVAVDRGLRGGSLRGSGYLVAPGRVLTAAHVVAEARSIRVLLDVGQRSEIDVAAKDWWASPVADLAVVVIPAEATRDLECRSALFGRISDTAAMLPVQASGFPLFKLRTATGGGDEPEVFRDLEDASGHSPVSANRLEGTLAVYLDDPAPDPESASDGSPWEGMSGGAVWVGDRIVAVVAQHHRAEGPGRLAARRVDRAYDLLDSPDLNLFTGLLGLPSTVDGLRDVVPPGPGQLMLAAYRAQVRSIAPDELIGRDRELAHWTEFCAGPAPYAWWQAGPWAGKSALASWFVTHPPAGLDVVSFFITSRLPGQADSHAFLEAMTEQLSLLASLDARTYAKTVGAVHGAWLSMLESAASQCAERGRRLVVVVDGLDEDLAGAVSGRANASIASLLPRRPPPEARFIITSRPDPGLPDDVPPGHPLRACQPVPLAPSRVASETELLAKTELRRLLSGDQAEVDAVGYIAGSGGGLTRGELAELTRVPPTRLDGILRGVSGRSLRTRPSASARVTRDGAADRVYLFGHETLRVTAEELLGQDLTRYRRKVHEWVGSYARSGWPDSTPGYAIRGYSLLLASIDLAGLSALARDSRRHEFLFRATGSDHAALAEISTAQQLIAGQDVPDLKAMVELAARQDVLSKRNDYISRELPVAWARLGCVDHAEALARVIPSKWPWEAIIDVAAVVAGTGDYDRAEALARTAPENPHLALRHVAEAVAAAGDYDRAEAIADTITEPRARADALADLAEVASRAGHYERAASLASAIGDPADEVQALAAVAAVIIEGGDYQEARRLISEARSTARTTTYAYQEVKALTELATLAARAGSHQGAHEMIIQAESTTREIADPSWHANLFSAIAATAAATGDLQRARELIAEAESAAYAVTGPYLRDQVLKDVADALADIGDYAYAEAIALTVTNTGIQDNALAHLSAAAAGKGQYEVAEAAARAISHPHSQDQALLKVADTIAEAGHYERAEALARTFASPEQQERALSSLAEKLAETAQHDRAIDLARSIDDPDWQAEVLSTVAARIAATRDNGRAEALARSIDDPFRRDQALSAVAARIAEAGDYERAEALADGIEYITLQQDLLITIAIALGDAGDYDHARQLAAEAEATARGHIKPYHRTEALGLIAAAVGRTGGYALAEDIIDLIDHPFEQALIFAEIAETAAGTGDHDRANELARRAANLASSISIPAGKTTEQADLAVSLARLGERDAAKALARSINDSPYARARALAGIAAATGQEVDRRNARTQAAEAAEAAHLIDHQGKRVEALADIAVIMSQVGGRDRIRALAAEAEQAARTIITLSDYHAANHEAEALGHVAIMIAHSGDYDRAIDLARTITQPHDSGTLRHIAAMIAHAGESDQATALARTITEPYSQAEALIDIAAKAGDHGQARRLAADAGAAALKITDPLWGARALADAAKAMARAGDQQGATELATIAETNARAIENPHERDLADLAATIAEAGDRLRATRLLAHALSMGTSHLWWLAPVSRYFPEDIGDALDVLVGAYGH